MSAGAPWSVKGIDPKAREVAKDLARRSGMTLGEWLNQMIMEGDAEEDAVVTPLARRAAPFTGADRRGRYRRLDDAYGSTRIPDTRGPRGSEIDDDFDHVARALEALTSRIEAAENRSTLAIGGVDQAVAGLLARLESSERDQSAASARVEHIAEALSDEQGRLLDRVRQVEREAETPRSLEALRALETALGKIANQLYEGDARTRAALGETRQDITAVGRRLDRVEAEAQAATPSQTVIEGVIARISERLEQAEARTSGAIRTLESSFSYLDQRLLAAEGRVGEERSDTLERLAEQLAARVEESRGQMVRQFEQAADGRFGQLDRALSDLSGQVQAAEKRSADAIEQMGHDVLRIAGNLDRRMTTAERSGVEAMERAQGEMARMAQAVEHRLRRADDVHAQALERLGQEIGKISERLTERLLLSERRSAAASEDMGERLGRVADKLDNRWSRAHDDLSDRIRQSEERTARLLEEARQTIDRGLARSDLRESGVAQPAAPPAQMVIPEAPPSPARSLAEPVWQEPRLSLPDPSPEPEIHDFDDFAYGATETAAFDPFAELSSAADAEELFTRPTPVPLEALDPFAATEPTVGFDEYSGDTEFVDPEDAKPRPPVSTREAIHAARAAARLGVRNFAGDDAPTAMLGAIRRAGLKSKLNERVEKQAQRDSGSTLRKALFASSVAAVAATCIYGYLQLMTGAGDQREAAAPPAEAAAPDQSHAPLAAVAIATPVIPPKGPASEAENLYQQGVARIADGKSDGVELLSKAANLGYAPAQFHLASLYTNGDAGLHKDPVEARRWTERAAEAGDRRAMFNLGMFWFEGSGGPQDQAQAAEWFRRAADRGLTDAQYNLAKLYEQGLGVKADPAQAYQWYLIAAHAGDNGARAGAETLRASLPPTERAAAEHAAQSFRAAGEPADVARR